MNDKMVMVVIEFVHLFIFFHALWMYREKVQMKLKETTFHSSIWSPKYCKFFEKLFHTTKDKADVYAVWDTLYTII